MGWYGEAPYYASAEIIQEIVKRHLNSNAMMVILPIQDWLAMSEKLRKEDAKSEQINIPANPYHYWNYRLHCQLETLIDNQDWTEFLKKFIKESKRAY